MIEKQFRLEFIEEKDAWAVYDTFKNEYGFTMSDILDLMNELSYENKQLKKDNEELKQDNDIKFWKQQLMNQWNKTQLIIHELSLAMDNGYEISDEYISYIESLEKKHDEHKKKIERLGI